MENMLPLTIEEVYLYYDGPKLFWATDDNKDNYLVTCVDEDDKAEIFLASRLTVEDIRKIDANKIPLRDAYDGTLSNELFVLRWGEDGSFTPIEVGLVKPDWLPTENVLLHVTDKEALGSE